MLTDSELALIAARLDGSPGPVVLDARPAADFAARHLRGAVSLPGVAEAAGDPAGLDAALPSIFLPPRHRALLVMADPPGSAQVLARALAARGRARVEALPLATADLVRLPARLLGHGASDRTLWEAPRWLVEHQGLLPPPALGPVLDLGSGSGRAAVWLAGRGHRVTALDWQPEALGLVLRLAASRGVTVATVQADLRAPGGVPGGPWAAIVNVRCLDRPLLARLHELVLPHGIVLVRAFREAPGLGPDVRAAHRLAPAELLRAFDRARWLVLAHEEGFDDDGRPAAGIVARRRDGRAVPG